MTTGTLIANILQLSMLILAGVSNNPNIPQSTRDQAVLIAQQGVNFANQNMVYLVNQNANTNPNTGTHWHGYYPGGVEVNLMILAENNADVSNLSAGQTYNLVWSPYDPSEGYVEVSLYSVSTGNRFISRSNSNNVIWTVSAAPGSYEVRLTQNGGVVVSRSVYIR